MLTEVVAVVIDLLMRSRGLMMRLRGRSMRVLTGQSFSSNVQT